MGEYSLIAIRLLHKKKKDNGQLKSDGPKKKQRIRREENFQLVQKRQGNKNKQQNKIYVKK